jgi:acyl-CoA thioesterase-2
MNAELTKLIAMLKPDELGTDRFRGNSHDIGTPQVFGGQVLGQALYAASLTVDGARPPHSLHAYFLRRGNVSKPIEYEVDRARDGASFSNRRVVASQQGRAIFNMTASFQKRESGIEHQLPMPAVPGPEGLGDKYDLADDVLAQMHAKLRAYIQRERPFMVRPVQPQDFLNPQKTAPLKQVWIKANDSLPDDPLLHQALFAYVSDYELLGTANLPHGISFTNQGVQMASLDHAVWFYHPFRVDEWLLFAYDSPVSAASRGLARGMVYTQEGKLVAMSAQEGLIRVKD